MLFGSVWWQGNKCKYVPSLCTPRLPAIRYRCLQVCAKTRTDMYPLPATDLGAFPLDICRHTQAEPFVPFHCTHARTLVGSLIRLDSSCSPRAELVKLRSPEFDECGPNRGFFVWECLVMYTAFFFFYPSLVVVSVRCSSKRRSSPPRLDTLPWKVWDPWV